MSIKVGKGSNNEYALIPPPKVGAHHSVCAEVFDRGVIETEHGPKPKVWIIFQVQETTEDSGTDRDGTHKEVWVGCNLVKLGPKTTLRKHLESWRGEPLEDDDFDEDGNFDLEKVEGVQATIVIGSWSAPNEDGRRYPNDITVLPPNDPSVKLDGENTMEVTDYVPVAQRKKAEEGSATPAPAAASSGSKSGGKSAKKPAPF